jgi:glycosidase
MNNVEINQKSIDGEMITYVPPLRSTLGMMPVKKSYDHLECLESPEWIQRAILYEIYVRNFTKKGNFAGVSERLPYLKKLGVNTLWLMPIHPIGMKGRKGKKGCPYSIRDYFALNSEYGTEEDFKKLVEATHKLDMRLILDLVIHHSANDHVMMTERNHWWKRDIKGYPTRRIKDWKDIADFNFQSKDLWNYLVDVMKYWVEQFDIDGYRCDVAGLVPNEFWEYAIPQVKEVKSDVFFMAEWEDPEMHVKTFNSTYNWTLYFKMLDVVENKSSAQEMFDAFLFKHHMFPKNSYKMNFIENHDMMRAAKLFATPQFQPFAGLIFTLPGIPLIYNGQEAGYSSYLSLFEQQSLAWKKKNPAVFTYYKDLISARSSCSALQNGTIHKMYTNDPAVVCFYRESKDDFSFCVLNFSDRIKKITLELPDIFLTKFQNEYWKPFPRPPEFKLQKNKMILEIFPWESIILTNQKSTR